LISSATKLLFFSLPLSAISIAFHCHVCFVPFPCSCRTWLTGFFRARCPQLWCVLQQNLNNGTLKPLAET
ncbi:hypothetical protein CLOP_g9922, partial [Closterium sp. NIES-67]